MQAFKVSIIFRSCSTYTIFAIIITGAVTLLQIPVQSCFVQVFLLVFFLNPSPNRPDQKEDQLTHAENTEHAACAKLALIKPEIKTFCSVLVYFSPVLFFKCSKTMKNILKELLRILKRKVSKKMLRKLKKKCLEKCSKDVLKNVQKSVNKCKIFQNDNFNIFLSFHVQNNSEILVILQFYFPQGKEKSILFSKLIYKFGD